MGIAAKLRGLFMAKGRAMNLKDRLLQEYKFLNFLYSTEEGLLIFGTYPPEDGELKAAKVPELLKILRGIGDADFYQIRVGDRIYCVGLVTSNVFFFGERKKAINSREFEEIREYTKHELELV